MERENLRVIMVASAVEEEKASRRPWPTWRSPKRARADAWRGTVDLDLRAPYMDRFFGLLHAQGITDVALGNVELEGRAA